MSQPALARKVRVRPDTLGKVIDRLERSALIGRSGTKGQLSITPAGRDLLHHAYAVEEEQERTFGSDEQLRSELINRIKALGLNSAPSRERPHLKLVSNDASPDEGNASGSSATG